MLQSLLCSALVLCMFLVAPTASSQQKAKDGIVLGIVVKDGGPPQGGVVVADVTKARVGDRLGLKVGDLILKVNDKEIRSTQSFLAELHHNPVTVWWKRGNKAFRNTVTKAVTASDQKVESIHLFGELRTAVSFEEIGRLFPLPPVDPGPTQNLPFPKNP